MKTIEITEETKLFQKNGSVVILEKGDKIQLQEQEKNLTIEVRENGIYLLGTSRKPLYIVHFQEPVFDENNFSSKDRFVKLNKFKYCLFYDIFFDEFFEAEFFYKNSVMIITFRINDEPVRREISLLPNIYEGTADVV